MDVVFKRYTSPFFLDYAIANNDLSEFVDMILKKQDEEMLWEMYLATLPFNEKTFNDWKDGIAGSNNTKVTKMSKKEIDATIKKAEEILRGFKPPQKGGK